MTRLICLLCLILPTGGCMTRGQHVIVREGMDKTTRTIRQEHKDWSKQAFDAGKLTEFDYRNRLATHKEYEDLVNEDRAAD